MECLCHHLQYMRCIECCMDNCSHCVCMADYTSSWDFQPGPSQETGITVINIEDGPAATNAHCSWPRSKDNDSVKLHLINAKVASSIYVSLKSWLVTFLIIGFLFFNLGLMDCMPSCTPAQNGACWTTVVALIAKRPLGKVTKHSMWMSCSNFIQSSHFIGSRIDLFGYTLFCKVTRTSEVPRWCWPWPVICTSAPAKMAVTMLKRSGITINTVLKAFEKYLKSGWREENHQDSCWASGTATWSLWIM